jgi:hypothetical protein
MSKDSYFWEQIHHVITGFVVAVGTLLDVSNLIEAGDLPKVREFRELLIEIRGICIALDKSSESISTRLEGRLKFIEVGRSLQESSGLWILSVLAVIFLPLSLASSLLSMQTRFVDLRYLMYDFFGVILLLGSFTVAVVFVVKFLSWGTERLRGSPAVEIVQALFKNRQVLFVTTMGFIVVIPWVLVLTSFLVGMIKDVGLGLKILGYGAAAMVGLVVIPFCIVLILLFMF